jgi:hypothetical protein
LVALNHPGETGESDALINFLVAALNQYANDPRALTATLFWVSPPIASRSADPEQALRESFGIKVDGPEDLVDGLRRTIPEAHPFKAAAERTLSEVAGNADGLFIASDWKVWREFDGPEFCNLAYQFFTNLCFQLFVEVLPNLEGDLLQTMSREMAVITRAFSARWFNACARFETPGVNNVRWYLGHCLGKLELELERETSGWVEPPRRRRNEIPHPTLDL